MDCARVDEELVAFQLAALDGATRAAVEAHLTSCARCVSSYLALKRAMDASEDAAVPSDVTRARVRAEAAKLLAAEPRPAPAAPGPTATAAAAVRRPRRARWAIAAAAAVMLSAPFWYEATRTAAPTAGAPPGAAPAAAPGKNNQTVDTARVTPENLAFL